MCSNENPEQLKINEHKADSPSLPPYHNRGMHPEMGGTYLLPGKYLTVFTESLLPAPETAGHPEGTPELAVGGFVSYSDCRTAGAEWEGAGVPHAPQAWAQSHSSTSLLKNANSAPSHPALKTGQ